MGPFESNISEAHHNLIVQFMMSIYQLDVTRTPTSQLFHGVKRPLSWLSPSQAKVRLDWVRLGLMNIISCSYRYLGKTMVIKWYCMINFNDTGWLPIQPGSWNWVDLGNMQAAQHTQYKCLMPLHQTDAQLPLLFILFFFLRPIHAASSICLIYSLPAIATNSLRCLALRDGRVIGSLLRDTKTIH